MVKQDPGLDLTLAETPQVYHYFDVTKTEEDSETALYRTILFAYYAGLAIGSQYEKERCKE